MNNKQIELKINNLIALRAAYFAIVIALTGGVITLMHHLNTLNTVLLIIGVFLDFITFSAILRITNII